MKLIELCKEVCPHTEYNPIKLDGYNDPIIPVLCPVIEEDVKIPTSISKRQVFQVDTQLTAQSAFFNEKNCARGDNY